MHLHCEVGKKNILLLFDVGGVLIQTVESSLRHKWEKRLGLPQDSLEPAIHNTELYRQLERNEITPDDFWLQICSRLGISSSEVGLFRDEFYAGDVLNEELILHIREWRQTCLIGIISNSPITLRHDLTNKYLISELFDHIIISAEVGIRKPGPDIYETALRLLDTDGDHALFVDDLQTNVDGARAVAIHGLLYHDNAQAIPEINRFIESVK